MANTTNRNNLGFLGIDFQYKLISTFFIDQGFFNDLNSIIDQNMFTDVYLRGIVTIIKDYYNKYSSVPSYGMLEIKINEKCLSEDELKYYNETLSKIKSVSSDGYREIEDMAEKFFKQQNIIKVANKLKSIASEGDINKYDDCQKILEDALSIGRHLDDDEWHPFDSVDDDLSRETVEAIPTGIDKLDELLGGGLHKGKIGIIICPSGKGKTSLTTCLTGNAAIAKTSQNNYGGYKVLQIVFEDIKRDMNRKFISKVSQIEQIHINDSIDSENSVREMIANYPDRNLMNQNIILKRLASGQYTPSDIKEIIKKKMNQGFKPDLVIIDYFECIDYEKGHTNSSEWKQQEKGIRFFENLAHELNIAIWIPTQGNRSSYNAEVVTEDKMGGSMKKVETAQVVISIARNTDDLKNNKATISVLKNRSGSVATFHGVYFNNGTCTVNTDNVIDFDSALAYNEYAQNENEKKKKQLIKQAMKIIKE